MSLIEEAISILTTHYILRPVAHYHYSAPVYDVKIYSMINDHVTCQSGYNDLHGFI